MKSLIFTTLASVTPMKEAPKQKPAVNLYYIDDKKKPKTVKTILDKNGNQVDTDYKGLVYLIDEDFSITKSIFN
jgi:hypothetical protein